MNRLDAAKSLKRLNEARDIMRSLHPLIDERLQANSATILTSLDDLITILEREVRDTSQTRLVP